MSNENVVFLAYDNPNAPAKAFTEYVSCKHCQNKTYTIVMEGDERFPLVRCAACGCHIGRMGWAPTQ